MLLVCSCNGHEQTAQAHHNTLGPLPHRQQLAHICLLDRQTPLLLSSSPHHLALLRGLELEPGHHRHRRHASITESIADGIARFVRVHAQDLLLDMLPPLLCTHSPTWHLLLPLLLPLLLSLLVVLLLGLR
jgi:hypothetical protein